MEFTNAAALAFWRIFSDWGFWLVVIGATGEVLVGGIERFFKNKFLKYESSWKIAELLFGFILIIGLYIEFKGHAFETRILDARNTDLVSTNLSLSLRVEELRKENNAFVAKLVSVETNMAQTSSNVDAIDPANQPLVSVTAFVSILYKTNEIPPKSDRDPYQGISAKDRAQRESDNAEMREFFKTRRAAERESPLSTTLMLQGWNGPSIILQPDTVPYCNGTLTDGTGTYFETFISLTWKAGYRESYKWQAALPHSTKLTTRNIADSITFWSLNSWFFDGNTHIVRGSVEVIFNSSIKKEYSIPSQWTSDHPSISSPIPLGH